MAKYTVNLSNSIVYSIGDTHGCGREVMDFVTRLELRSCRLGEAHPAYIQLGDLCDGFAFPEDRSVEALRIFSEERLKSMPELRDVLFRESNHFVDWTRNDGVRGLMTGRELFECSRPDVVEAVYQAFRCFETLHLYSRFQQRHPNDFFVIFGNHDGDILRGRCAYGRQQKYILLGLLGLSPDAVINHMQNGKTSRVLRHPCLRWLNQRPHIILSRDTVYMHGGPTGELGASVKTEEAFSSWLLSLDNARSEGMDHPLFKEHESFLSPDGSSNDWLMHPECIRNFLHAANKKYLAVGHSPFLDYEKGPMLDLEHADENMKKLFRTPAQLPPDKCLIKHDTNMKRVGELWACRHEIGTDIWTGIDADLNEFPLRCS